MDEKDKMNFRRISLAAFTIYTMCVAVLFFGVTLFNILSKQSLDLEWQEYTWRLIFMVLIWILIITPQFILFKYVSNFKARWAQLVFLILQIIAFIFPLYYHGKVLLLMGTEDQPVETLLSLPIWECVIIIAMGLIFKAVQSY